MRRCWDGEPARRPTFVEIVHELAAAECAAPPPGDGDDGEVDSDYDSSGSDAGVRFDETRDGGGGGTAGALLGGGDDGACGSRPPPRRLPLAGDAPFAPPLTWPAAAAAWPQAPPPARGATAGALRPLLLFSEGRATTSALAPGAGVARSHAAAAHGDVEDGRRGDSAGSRGSSGGGGVASSVVVGDAAPITPLLDRV